MGAGSHRFVRLWIVTSVGLVACQFDRPPDVRGIDAPPEQVALTLTIEGAGAGTVAVAPGDFACDTGTCSRTFAAGTEVTLAAMSGSALDAVATVAGDCTALPCTLTMAGPRAVTVGFQRFTCEPNTSTCSAGRLSVCGPDGEYRSYVVPNGNGEQSPTTLLMHDYTCPLGCHATQPRCADVDTQMELNAVLDSAAVSDAGDDVVIPATGSPTGTITIDTSSWDATLHEVRLTDTSGQALRVPAEVVVQAAPAPEILVLATRTFTLRSGSTLNVIGNRALAIVSHYDLLVEGIVDLSAVRGASVVVAPGAVNVDTAPCTGRYVAGISGGGTNACQGGAGSNASAPGTTPMTIPPALAGGCPGGFMVNLSTFHFSGGGGGGFALVSRTQVRLGAASIVDVSGGYGWAGTGWATGGGSGGTVIITAPTLVVASGAIVAGRGGSGGAAGPTSAANGQEGPVQGSTGASGATCTGCGVSGAGGYEAACGRDGTGGGTALAGGGGDRGRAAVYTFTSPLIPAGTMHLRYQPQSIAVRSP